MWTVEGRAAALDDPPHRTARAAGPPFPAVDRETFRKITELAIWRGEVAQGRTTGGNGLGKNILDRGHQPLESFNRNRSARALGVYARAEQRLADVNVAEARDGPLIEEQRLDRCRSSGEAEPELLGRHCERLRAKRRERWPVR